MTGELLQQALVAAAGVLVGLPLLVLLWRRPLILAAATLLAILFVRTIEHFLPGVPFLGVLDDVFTALTIVRGFGARLNRPRGRRAFPGLPFFAGFAVLGFLSAVQLRVPLAQLAGATYLPLKGIALGWAFAQLPWTPAAVRQFARRSGYVAAFILVCTAINAVIPGAWAAQIDVTGGLTHRYGLPALTGPFIHPFDLAYATSMMVVAAVAYRRYLDSGGPTLAIIVGGGLATLASVRRKDVVGLLLTMVVQVTRYLGPVVLIPVVLVGVVVAYLLGPEIVRAADQLATSYLQPGSREARTVLTQGAGVVALRYFPLGAGFGRYGSRSAAVNYSPEYVRLGFDRIAGLRDGVDNAYLTDTSWPAIVGEAGFIGAALFALGILSIAWAAIQWERDSSPVRVDTGDGLFVAESSTPPELWFLGGTLVGWTVLTLFQSVGAPIFTSPPGYGLFFAVTGMAVALDATPAARAERT